MHQFLSITLRKDIPNLSDTAQVEEGGPSHMFYVGAEGKVLVKNDSRVARSCARGQGDAI